MTTAKRSFPRRVLRAVTWPVRGRRAIVTLALVFGGPWLWMSLFTPDAGTVRLAAANDERRSVAVVDWGHHTSILIEQPSGWRLGPPGDEAAGYVEFGWGDRRFYKDSDLRPHVLVNAALLPSASTVYVRGFESLPPHEPGTREVLVRTCEPAVVSDLVHAIERCVVRTDTGDRAAPFDPVERYRGRFYPGRESYIFWSNCNRWTLVMLESAGLDVGTSFVFTSGQVMRRLDDWKPPR